MTVEERNVATLKQAYQLWHEHKENAFQHWLDLMDADIGWRSLADGAKGVEFTIRRTSKDGVLQYFQSLAREWEIITPKVDIFRMRDDKIVDLFELYDTAMLLAAAS